MLKVRYRDDNDTKVYSDINMEFDSIRLYDTPVVRRIIEDIEEGQYCDEYSFIDRFGYKLDKEYMSTGCKTALLIETYSILGIDKEVDTAECGLNAKDAIIRLCRNGRILIRELMSPISFEEDEDDFNIDIELDGYRFTRAERLNEYITEPFPDMTLPGVQKIN